MIAGRLPAWLAPEEGDARDLAVFRFVVAIVIAFSESVAVAPDWAALPAASRVAPLGVQWLLPHLAITPVIVLRVRGVMLVACMSAALGLFSRTSFALVACAASYVFLVPQLGGAVFHDHHLLWLAVLLAASPCGDAFSLDALIARRRGAPRPVSGRAHGLAIRVAWVVIALIFFFPGVHKLSESGFAWILSDNLRDQLWWKWAQDPSLVPALRIDRVPWLMHLLAACAVLFELTFGPLVFARRTRPFAVLAALCFHAATRVLMGIDFSVLYVCYVVFVPWHRLLPKRAGSSRDDVRGTALVSVLLLTGIASAGALGAMQAYPFACYPTFAPMPGAFMPSLAIEISRDDGTTRVLPPDLYAAHDPRAIAQQWRLVGAYGDYSSTRLRAWWRSVASRDPVRGELEHVQTIRFYRVDRSVDPDHPDETLAPRLLLTL